MPRDNDDHVFPFHFAVFSAFLCRTTIIYINILHKKPRSKALHSISFKWWRTGGKSRLRQQQTTIITRMGINNFFYTSNRNINLNELHDATEQHAQRRRKKNFINIRGCVTFNYVFGLFYEREGCKSIIYYNYYNNNNNDIGQFSTTTNNYNQ